MSDASTNLPDVVTQPQDDGVLVIANKRARKLLNAGFKKPRPRWETIEGGSNYLKSPEYRALTLDGNCEAVVSAMLHACHQAGMLAMFICAKCSELHVVNDEQAARFWATAVEHSGQSLPEHNTIQ